ncbi:PIR protein CIR protein [Plasmodium vinckei vinckei]|uniref:PIR protein CIR protein n=1 Tax=Plasmodium vinckei vinckei TaxID=54757 RepID=A0A449BQC0_PLAVN|nr:PIR protein CIR protein [Plasmodium vinckei vinckei]VEV55622.1 PIR protein CIR protein [Plasmodium vinckei vinckei]
MNDKVCDILSEVDNLFVKGTVNVVKFNKNSSLLYNCPYDKKRKEFKCTNNNERINALGSYLYNKLLKFSKDFEGGGNDNNRHIELFIIWLGDKLFKIESDYKETMEESYKKHLENHMGNFNYWRVIYSKSIYKDASIRKMNQFYTLLNNICKLITEYKKNPQKPDRNRLRNHFTQCLNYYRSIHVSINECKPYIHLLDSLKMMYEIFRLQQIVNNNSIPTKEKELLIKRVESLTTFKNENKYLLPLSAKLSFGDKECIEARSKDEQIGKSIATKNLHSKPKGAGLPKKTDTGAQRKPPTQPVSQPQSTSPTTPKPRPQPRPQPQPQPRPQPRPQPQPQPAAPPEPPTQPPHQKPQSSPTTSTLTPPGPPATPLSGSPQPSKSDPQSPSSLSPPQPIQPPAKHQVSQQQAPESQTLLQKQTQPVAPVQSAGPQQSGPSLQSTDPPPATPPSGSPSQNASELKSPQTGDSNNSKEPKDSGNGKGSTGGTKDNKGDPNDRSKDPADGSSDPASNTSGGYFNLGPSIFKFLLNGTENLKKTSEFIKENQQKVKEVTEKISNVYNDAKDNLKNVYDKSNNYLNNFINDIIDQLNQTDPSSKQNGNNSGTGNPPGGGNLPIHIPPPQPPSTTDPTNPPPLPPLNPPSTLPKDPLPTTPTDPSKGPSSNSLPTPLSNPTPNTSPDPPKGSSQQKQSPSQSQPITLQNLQSSPSNQKIFVQLGKSLSSDPNLKTKWNLPTTWNGSVDCKYEIKFMNTTLVCCTYEQCSLTGISVTFVLIPIILLIAYKYLSFGSSKKSEKKNMKRVINFHDGKSKTKIIISSNDRRKHLKPVINSVGRKKYPLLNIYKLMQADPIPFINLFFLLIFFVYKRKENFLEL